MFASPRSTDSSRMWGEFLEEIRSLDPEATEKHRSEVLQAELFSEA